MHSLLKSEYLHACDGELPNMEFAIAVSVHTTNNKTYYSLDHIKEKCLWCVEQRIHVAWNKPHFSEYENHRTFYFRNEKDAIYFKTVWA